MPPQVRPSSSSSIRQSATAEQSGASEVVEHCSSSIRLRDLAEESATSEVKEQRTNRGGARGSGKGQATEQQSGIALSSQQTRAQGREAEQTDGSCQSTESVAGTTPQPLSKHAKKKAKKNKRKKAPQSTVSNVH